VDGITGAVVTDATVTAQIYELDGTAVGAPLSLEHTAGGIYQGQFPLATASLLERGTKYEVETKVIKAGKQQVRRTKHVADYYGQREVYD